MTQVKSYYESYVKYDSAQNNAKCALCFKVQMEWKEPVSVLLEPGNMAHVFKYELSVCGLVIICVCQDFTVLVCM